MGCQQCKEHKIPSKSILDKRYNFQQDLSQTPNQIFKNSIASENVPPNDFNERIKCNKPLVSYNITQMLNIESTLKYDYNSSEIQGSFEDQYYKFQRTGNTYIGQWNSKKKPHGYGTMHFSNGSVYQGIFIDGLPFNHGKLMMKTGGFYQGQISYGRANGYGIYINQDYTYKGHFRDNQKHGKGEERQQNAYTFQGQYQNGEKTKGIYRYNGNIYEGQFQNDEFQGKGTLTLEDGNRYEGQFKYGRFNGYGEFLWKDGSKYRGYYIDGSRQGFGEFFNIKDSSLSKGMWKQGVLNGEGQYKDYRNRLTKCIWSNGKMMGIKTA